MVVGYIGASRAETLFQLDLWYAAGVGLGIGLSYVPAIGAGQASGIPSVLQTWWTAPW